MATIWLARVRGGHGFEKLFAVKTILPHLAKVPSFRDMFLDEARIASRVRHGNVARIVDLGEDAGVLYMVLEWVPGDPWSKLIAATVASGDAIAADVMLRIAAGTCAGLHAAHELCDEEGRLLHVVHRDVSPQNVLITEGGTVKVIDFGVAKAIGRTGEHTRVGLIKGNAAYMAPEQASGRAVDRRADIWAVGAVLYEIFAGRPPYEGANDLLVLQRIASQEPPAPLPPETPADVATMIEQALEFHPDRRFQTALDMQRAIEACIKNPIAPEAVAALLYHYLAPAIGARRRAIAEALDEADEQSTGLLVPPDDADATIARGSDLVTRADRVDAAESQSVDLDLSELSAHPEPATAMVPLPPTTPAARRRWTGLVAVLAVLALIGLAAGWARACSTGPLPPFEPVGALTR
jgi:serine/threonine protein kinase